MTWKEFKELVEAAGVRDEDLLGYIDISGADGVHAESDGTPEKNWQIT